MKGCKELRKADEPKMVPVDLEGHVLRELTQKQKERKVEIEYERLMKTSNKLEWRNWTREEKHMMITWAFRNNFDTSIAEFKHLVDMFKFVNREMTPKIIRSSIMPGKDEGGRAIDVWCNYCGRIHVYRVPLILRGTWELFFNCRINEEKGKAFLNIEDNSKVGMWEFKAKEKIMEKYGEEKLDIIQMVTVNDVMAEKKKGDK